MGSRRQDIFKQTYNIATGAVRHQIWVAIDRMILKQTFNLATGAVRHQIWVAEDRIFLNNRSTLQWCRQAPNMGNRRQDIFKQPFNPAVVPSGTEYG